MVDANTKVCCVIGNPVRHSLSPVMHNAAYEMLHLNFRFVAFETSDIVHAIAGVRALGIRLAAITIPFKKEVCRYVDEIDETAQEIGAANTVINENGKLKAINTDWTGAIQALEEKTNLSGKSVALLGAGGAAYAIAYGLVKKKATVFVFNRTKEHAKLLAEKFQLAGYHGLGHQSEMQECDIIINTTSVGLHPDSASCPISEASVQAHHIVFDAIYTPKITTLLSIALEKKAHVVYGYKMLLYSGIGQFELATGKKAPIQSMENALLNELK